MATVPITQGSSVGVITPVELTGADDFTATTGILVVSNQSGGAITLSVKGDGVPNPLDTGCGAGDIDTTSPYALPEIQAGETLQYNLSNISAWLTGTVAVTGGAASVEAWIIQA